MCPSYRSAFIDLFIGFIAILFLGFNRKSVLEHAEAISAHTRSVDITFNILVGLMISSIIVLVVTFIVLAKREEKRQM